ncbi:MAG: LTA synthase family protein [Bdellovibrionales bacterium]|nr:LTA synthase family protein [Bdellovibrionales bacterium]
MKKRHGAAIWPWAEMAGANLLGLLILNLPLSLRYGDKLSARLVPSELLVLGTLVYPWFFFFKPRTAFLGGVLTVGLLSFANCLRMANLDFPLLPSDIHFLFQAQLLVAYSPLSVVAFVSALPLFTGWAIYQRGRDEPFTLSAKWRRQCLALWLLALSWASLLAFHPKFIADRMDFLSLYQGKQWRLGKDVTRDGLANTLAFGVGELGLQRPTGLSRLDSLKTLKQYRPLTPAAASPALSPPRQSLVVILLESFVDPYVYGVKLSADPIPNFRALSKRHAAHQVLVPTFGGGTATTSFELLTGISVSELKAPTHPFLDLIYQPTHSLVWTFRRNGYATLGLHNFLGGSWRRSKVWPFLGFERSLFLESMPGAKQSYRGFPESDVPLFNRIRDEIKSAKGPFFLYGVTVALHAPYFPRARPAGALRVLQSPDDLGIRRRHKAMFEEYLNRLQQMDAELLPAIEYLESQKIPFVLFGDHHSPLANVLMKNKWGEGDEVAKHSTPLLIQSDLAASMQLPRTVEMSCLAGALASAMKLRQEPIDQAVFRDCEVASAVNEVRQNILYDVFHSGLGFEGGTP